jgi:trypsin
MHLLSLASILAIAGSVNAIIGGTAATKDDAPFIAGLQQGDQYFCAGSLISEKHILTSAACIKDQPAAQVEARLGSLQHNSGGKLITASSYEIHPEFDSKTFENNIALITLSEAYSATTPIPLPSNNNTIADGSTVRISGWGTIIASAREFPTSLQTTTIQTVPLSDCQSAYNDILPITEDEICAGVSGGGKGTCSHDEGGPVVDSIGTLVGVTSHAKGCASASYPDIEMRVGAYLDWINSKLT